MDNYAVYDGLVGLENVGIIDDADALYDAFAASGLSAREWWDGAFPVVDSGGGFDPAEEWEISMEEQYPGWSDSVYG